MGITVKTSKITAVDFFDDLGSPYARKWFFWGFICLCVGCLAVIGLERNLMPKGILQDVVDGVFMQVLTGSLIILAFYGIYVHFIGPNPGLREVTAVRPRDISGRMKELPVAARSYMFWGRSGSYFRSEPLLKLDEQAKVQKRNIDVEVVLPDPMDERLIRSYRDILSSLGEDSDGNPLLANVLATSMACAIVSANNKYINIRVYYSKFLPAFRVDLSDNGAIMTQDDKAKSALFFDFGSEFYEMLVNTVRNETAVSREVKWDEAVFKGRKLEAKSCDKETLNAFGIELDDVDALQQEVAKMITERKHRYK
ncbi:hypothetical protein NKH80_16855 [Mesorhizobium sp. M0904]|uniref:hypothetical protein n=1 Tax=Mesorhizobium sp. M0904 TaxID=2957022 RepID=UPI00333DA4D5